MKKFKKAALIILVLCLLATPVFAVTKSVQATLYYRDIETYVDGVRYQLMPGSNGTTVEPFIIDGSTYVPLRAIAEILGCEVEWDDAASKITVTSPAMQEMNTKFADAQAAAEADPAAAAAVYQELAEKDYTPAIQALAAAYAAGNGVEQNDKKAIELYQELFKLGSYGAIISMDELYRKTGDYTNALEIYELAIADGNMKAPRYAGVICEYGLGDYEVDTAKAREFYEIAAASGDTTGRTFLGRLYFRGNGIEQDYQKAFELFDDTEKNPVGHEKMTYEACYWLGVMYENGYYVEQNLDTAIAFYLRSYNYQFHGIGYEITSDTAAAALDRLGVKY